jgi:hypothetical protein
LLPLIDFVRPTVQAIPSIAPSTNGFSCILVEEDKVRRPGTGHKSSISNPYFSAESACSFNEGRRKCGAIAVSSVLAQLIGQSFFEDLLQRFQNLMIYLDHESYHRFFDPFFNERYPQLANKEEQKTLDFQLWPIQVGHTAVGYGLIDQLEQTALSISWRRAALKAASMRATSYLQREKRWSMVA